MMELIFELENRESIMGCLTIDEETYKLVKITSKKTDKYR